MPRFTFTEVAPHRWRITKAEAIPTWIEIAPKVRLVDLPAALASADTTAARAGDVRGGAPTHRRLPRRTRRRTGRADRPLDRFCD